MSSTPHRARQALEEIGRQLPGIWAELAARRERDMACGSWPDWCFAPLRTATPIITERGTTFDHPLLCMKLTGLAAWRMSQGIYRVDPTLYKALAETALDGDIPVDVLLRMPEWAVYIELQGDMATLRGPAQGVWVWMEPVIMSRYLPDGRMRSTTRRSGCKQSINAACNLNVLQVSPVTGFSSPRPTVWI